MSLRKGLLMAILLLLGAAYVLRLDRATDSADHTTVANQGSKRVFPDIEDAQITSIRVVSAANTYAVKKQAADSRRSWRFELPPDAPASQRTMERIVHLVTQLESENVIAAEQVDADQSIYGLAPPELFATVIGTFGERKMSFGKKHPLSGRRYLQPENDGRIFLIDDSLFNMLNQSPDQLRERHPGTFEPGEVTTIVTVNPEAKPMVFRRIREEAEGIDHWQLQSDGKEYVADGDVIHRELTELAGLEAKEFIDNAAQNMMLLGLSQPKLMLRVTLGPDATGKPKELMFQIGQGVGVNADELENPELRNAFYMKLSGEPWVYRFEKGFFRDWLQPPEHFLDRTPFDALSGEDFASVRVERAVAGKQPESFTLEHRTQDNGSLQWTIVQDGQTASAEGVDQWLEHFFALKVISYPALGDAAKATYGFDAPLVKITLEPMPEETDAAEDSTDESAPQPGTPVAAKSAAQAKEAEEKEPLEPPASRKTLLIGNLVAQAESEPNPQGISVSPRYGGIVDGAGQPVPVVLSGITVEELNKPAAYFSKK